MSNELQRRAPQQARRWCFTLHSAEDEKGELDLDERTKEVDAMWSNLSGAGATMLCLQLESAPSTGRLHYQGYVRFSKQLRLSAFIRLLPGCHAECTRGTEPQNIAYVTKEESRIAGPWRFGEESKPGRRTDITRVREMVVEGKSLSEIIYSEEVNSYQAMQCARLLIRHRPMIRRDEPPKVFWFHGSTGTGKTRFVWDFAEEKGLDMWVSHPENLNWFDGYDGEKVALFDDFRASTCPFSKLLRLLDRYPMRVPVKGDFTSWNPDYIFITSPYKPKYIYRRFEDHVEDLAQLTRRITEIRLFGDPVKPPKPCNVSNGFREV